MSEEVVENEKATDKKRKGAESGVKKLRIVLPESEENPLTEFQREIRNRGIKNFDLGAIVVEALAQVDEDWWKTKLESLTPLEYKLQAALENPDMREKLISILNNGEA